MNPVKGSLKYPQVTLVLTLAAVGLGAHALMKMPRREDPKITIRTGLVIAAYPGATPEQVEKQVSEKIEERLFRFEEVRKAKTFSTSRPGLAVVNVELEDHVKQPDLFWSKLRHNMIELKQTSLPDGVRGPIVDDSFGDTVALLIALHGGNYSYLELKEYAQRIEDEFRTSRAVAKLQRFGEQREEIRITSSMERLAQYGFSPINVIMALQGRNVVQYAGSLKTGDADTPMKTSGLFETENQIRQVMVSMSPTGIPIHIGDMARVERGYSDPSALCRFNGERAVLVSVEMLEGNNIVDFGRELRGKLDGLRGMMPPDLKIDLIADQPAVVENRITHFIREFGIAIGSVILVTMLLLPFRVALIASLAIPVTVAGTFASLQAFGVELHQVSIAALIVVLGMVVDDAIVIADNYVELLDRHVPLGEAAWRCATELNVPVLTATATIIFAFLPMMLISGSVGEFIRALPIAVAVSLTVSFVVAMLLTPILCRFFIKRGLHEGKRALSAGILDALQRAYGAGIRLAMKHKTVTVACGVLAFAGGLLIQQILPQRFFPTAERPQFVIDLWLREGARLEATDAAIQRIEQHLRKDKMVANFASFTGRSAPRFYYNVNPEFPAHNYGQVLVNTTKTEATPAQVYRLRRELASVFPEARVVVKELEQGKVIPAPVEVRISGRDSNELKSIGARATEALREAGGADFVYDNWHEDSYDLAVDLKHEVADRLGLSTASVSLQLGGGFSGLPVTNYWEGDREVPVVLQLDPERRTSYSDVADMYVVSSLTGARVPVRAVADLRPEWRESRIVRRNGVRTLTVMAVPAEHNLASAILKSARKGIESIRLPEGYRIEFGGEQESQAETFSEMKIVMALSLVSIFLILLFQFRSIRQTLVVMISIPLALLGAMVGLLITRNPFSFTAFMGLISLSGVVVRNAIILVEYINERRIAGTALEEAALEAGERRLRPIFLTTAAAAVGVTPMIISGSSLWSPLASAIAVGLMFSMFFTLVVIPVCYVLLERRGERKRLAGMTAMLVCGLLLAPWASGQEPAVRRITVDEAVDMAVRKNPFVKLAALKVKEAESRRAAVKANAFPQLGTVGAAAKLGQQLSITLPAGSLGMLPGIGLLPPADFKVGQGLSSFQAVGTSVKQPVTQLFRISSAVKAAAADARIADDDLAKARAEVAFKTKEAFHALLLRERQLSAARAEAALADELLKEGHDAVESGAALRVKALEAEALTLERRNAIMSAEIAITDLRADFNDLVGLPPEEPVELVETPPDPLHVGDVAAFTKQVLDGNPEVQAAADTVEKARHGVSAAKREYIPDIGVGVWHIYQNGVPLLPRNLGVVAAQLEWSIWDWGKRGAQVSERQSQLEQAEENLRRLKSRVAIDAGKAYRRAERMRDLVTVADRARMARKEARRISADQVELGVATQLTLKQADAALAQAEARVTEAHAGLLIAEAELMRLAGSH